VIVVVDASALITLARIGRLNILREVADQVYIPEAVYGEVVGSGKDRPGSVEVAQASWISRRRVGDHATVARLREEIGRGEAEAIVLAREIGADFVILDDASARRIAEKEGDKVSGLLGFLIAAKERGVVQALKPILDEMIAIGFFVDDPLYESILRQAGEKQLS